MSIGIDTGPARLLAVGLATLAAGCGVGAPEWSSRRSPVVNGADDRRELYEVPAGDLRTRVEESVVALLPRAASRTGPGGLVLTAPSLSEAAGLCDGERFAAQPAAAFCTGVLVDWDLVLTAGHCARVLANRDIAVVFGYAYAASGRLAATAADLYGVRAIVAERLDPWGADPRLDFAFFRLDRAAAPPRRPAPVRVARLALPMSLPLVVAGASGGAPLKVDEGATIVDPRAATADYFVASSDTSHGSSGGPAFDAATLALVGVFARGAPDFEVTAAGCNVESHAPNPAASGEQFSYTGEALAALCETAPMVSALCRTECGDPCRATDAPPGAGGCAVGGGAPPVPWGILGLFVAAGLGTRPRAPRGTAARQRKPGSRLSRLAGGSPSSGLVLAGRGGRTRRRRRPAAPSPR